MIWSEIENYKSIGICLRRYLFEAILALKWKNWENAIWLYYDLQLQIN
jgi:hypothetical protein